MSAMNIERVLRMVMRRFLMKGARKVMSDKGMAPTPGAKKAGQTMKVARRFGRMAGRF
ncbi:MAG: hypothetical protein KJN60_09625 [Boseongicola sp.]|nr:hypothetical protein [Boseongicola sp.]